jgi:hypothetical protein
MSLTDPTKVDSLILSETLRKTLLRPSHFRQLLNTKSSSLMRQITQPTMYNSSYGRLLRSLVVTVGSSSPATSRTKSLNPSTPVARLLSLELEENKNLPSLHNSSKESKRSWIRRVLNMSQKFLSNSLTNISPIGDESSMNANAIRRGVKSMRAFLHISPMLP